MSLAKIQESAKVPTVRGDAVHVRVTLAFSGLLTGTVDCVEGFRRRMATVLFQNVSCVVTTVSLMMVVVG